MVIRPIERMYIDICVDHYYTNSVTLGRPGVILKMFRNKIFKKKKKFKVLSFVK